MAWLCGCGNGDLIEEEPPEYCDLCGFALWGYFGLTDTED